MTVDIEEFRQTFLRRGWRGIERNYGSSSAVLMQLIAKAGGPALLAERRALQPCGRKAGGNARISPLDGRTDAIAVSEAPEGLKAAERADGACGADLERV